MVIKSKGVYCSIYRRSTETKDDARHFRPEIASLPVHFKYAFPSASVRDRVFDERSGGFSGQVISQLYPAIYETR